MIFVCLDLVYMKNYQFQYVQLMYMSYEKLKNFSLFCYWLQKFFRQYVLNDLKMRYVVSFLRFFSHTNICIGPTTEIHNVFANCVQCALEVSKHIYIVNRKHEFTQKFTRKYCFNCFFTHWYQKVKYLMTCYIRCITFNMRKL